ncbi:MAG: cytidine deaminase [Candidatus Sumerlaeia bacterium]|nr:cytidine deaminase [Candidatus Sumerlaeia bacterium]
MAPPPIDDATIHRLLGEARLAQSRAYAPYSDFHVGAALLTERGEVFGGCNVENASYGLTNCAERVAIGAMVAAGGGRPVACVVLGPKPDVLTPCGACRQVLAEFNRDMPVLCFGSDGAMRWWRVAELLPGAFDASALAD